MKGKLTRLAVTFISGMLAASLAVGAPPPGKVPRIGYLVLSPLLDTPSPERAAFVQGLRELGYIQGKSIIIEYRSAEGDPEALPFRAAELVDLEVDVIVAAGALPALAAKDVTGTIPIVMLFSSDPVRTGLVTSLARPGGNVTGMSFLGPELGAKRLELLKETIPRISRVAVLWDSGNFAIVPEWTAIQTAARSLGITLDSFDIKESPNFAAAFAKIAKDTPDGLITIADLRTAGYREIISEFALEHRIPTMSGLRDFAVSGGLMSYAPSFPDLSRRAANYVDKILKGAKPADLPVEQPTKFELVINMKTAQALDVTIPQPILIRADELIE